MSRKNNTNTKSNTKTSELLSKKSSCVSNAMQALERVAMLEESIAYTFINKQLLMTALTHSSAINELPESERTPTSEHNERLEFLGDAILELVISEELFSKYPFEREGALTHTRSGLVKEQTLAELAKEISLDSYIILGKGANSQGARALPSVLSDAYEALLAAIYLDAKNNTKYSNPLEPVQNIVLNSYKDLWPEIARPKVSKDYKTLLQERTQALYKSTPKYALIDCSGPEHQKEFTIELTLPNNTKIIQSAKNKRTAEQEAAAKALELLK